MTTGWPWSHRQEPEEHSILKLCQSWEERAEEHLTLRQEEGEDGFVRVGRWGALQLVPLPCCPPQRAEGASGTCSKDTEGGEQQTQGSPRLRANSEGDRSFAKGHRFRGILLRSMHAYSVGLFQRRPKAPAGPRQPLTC